MLLVYSLCFKSLVDLLTSFLYHVHYKTLVSPCCCLINPLTKWQKYSKKVSSTLWYLVVHCYVLWARCAVISGFSKRWSVPVCCRLVWLWGCGRIGGWAAIWLGPEGTCVLRYSSPDRWMWAREAGMVQTCSLQQAHTYMSTHKLR